MKNFERYNKEIRETDGGGCVFRKKHVLGGNCDGVSCNKCWNKFLDWLMQEYTPQIDWGKVPVDTPVICHKSHDYNSTLKRHVKKVSDNTVITFNGGVTSHTATEYTDTTCWDLDKVELARPEDIEKYSI
jgi:hypothetical protein